MKDLIYIPDVWTADQCQDWITQSEKRGWQDAAVETGNGLTMAQHIRKNKKREDVSQMMADDYAAKWSFSVSQVNSSIRIAKLFPVWRTYRYDEGDRFIRHRDGMKHLAGDTSAMTVLLYLNDDFEGGETVFYPESGSNATNPLSIKPQRGALLMFPHRTWHAGSPVRCGSKFVLRTDAFLSTV